MGFYSDWQSLHVGCKREEEKVCAGEGGGGEGQPPGASGREGARVPAQPPAPHRGAWGESYHLGELVSFRDEVDSHSKSVCCVLA